MCESVSVCFCVCSFVGTSVSVSIVLMSVAVSEYCVCTFLLSACSSAFEYVCLFVQEDSLWKRKQNFSKFFLLF